MAKPSTHRRESPLVSTVHGIAGRAASVQRTPSEQGQVLGPGRVHHSMQEQRGTPKGIKTSPCSTVFSREMVIGQGRIGFPGWHSSRQSPQAQAPCGAGSSACSSRAGPTSSTSAAQSPGLQATKALKFSGGAEKSQYSWRQGPQPPAFSH